jgi:predicted nucleic acid-binding protein
MSWRAVELAGIRDDLSVITTQYALDEAERKLQQKDPDSLGEYGHLTTLVETCPAPDPRLTRHVRWLVRDEDDWPILAGAISAEADWLLTKDGKHFGHLYGISVYDVFVTTPAAGLHRFGQLQGVL